MTSRIPGFYRLGVEERRRKVAEIASLSDGEVRVLEEMGCLGELADRMIENVISVHELPLGIATNFIINGVERLIPMAIEEPSVVAAASNAAKLARPTGGFTARADEQVMIGQVQLIGVPSPHWAAMRILEHKEEILDLANEQDPVLVRVGGGARDLEVRVLESPIGPMVVVHLLVDVRDAMGANAVNTMAEAVAPRLEQITGGRALLRILSNLAVHRLARAWVRYAADVVGEEVVQGVHAAWAFAYADPFRAATHNKGIMNGIDAVAIATGNDWRAIEAGAHAYAALKGYRPLTTWEIDGNGDLVGTIELPIQVGVIGGATKTHPKAAIARKILGVSGARELAEVMAAVGLAQNFAALRALATEGIQKGHMKLHARNIAIMAGARGPEIDLVVREMLNIGKVRVDIAREILGKIRKSK
ncbi:MAG TPA: hydroxymethylglutaryl-CoA reductase, degradative [Aciduliprofundum sp.]|nr:hydroxymethylglutaryl-CoA reductase, degradative [Aciduliprofundum sp.]